MYNVRNENIFRFKEGEQLSANDNYIVIDEENNSLVINSATINDTGVYECAVDRDLLNVDLRATIKVQSKKLFLAIHMIFE